MTSSIGDTYSANRLCHTLPVSEFVVFILKTEDNTIRLAVGLHLHCAVCKSHTCPCGATVDPLGQHALSCKKNASRVQRHAWLNDPIYRALIRDDIPAVKVPQGLSRNDGMTAVPWQSRRSGTWNVTVVHTIAESYVSQSVGRKRSDSLVREEDSQIQQSVIQPCLLPSGRGDRHSVLWLMTRTFSWQRSAGRQCCAQSICGKRSCISVFHWRFSVSTPCVWPTR